jgi:hypothetical protein
MNSMQDRETKLREALRTAYQDRRGIDLDDLWQAKVMSHIRSLGSIDYQMDFSVIFNRFLWRLTPVVCLLILILAAVLMNFDFTPEYELTRVYITDTVQFVTGQLWGV